MEHRFTLRVSNTMTTIMAARKIRAAAIVTLALVGALAPISSATAQTQTIPLEAGKACAFPLTITIVGQQPIYNKIFLDKNGNAIRYLSAGKGTTNTFKNEQTGASITLKPNGGSVSKGTVNDDGTITFVATGFNTIAWYPTDVPAGPSTILYIGRVVYTVDPSTNVSTVLGTTGKQTDICATLSATP